MKLRIIALSGLIISCLLVISCGGPEERKMEFFNKGKALLEEGDYVRARLEIRNALQIDPKFAEGYLMLGQIELEEQNWRRAFGALNKALELDPDNMDYLNALADFYLKRRKFQKAKQITEQMVARHPDVQTGHELLKGIKGYLP